MLVLAFSFHAFAQEGTILGTVTDPSGAAVANVGVTITNLDTGAVAHMKTNDVGQYVAPNLHIGRYDVRAETANFKAAEQKDIILQLGDRHRVDFSLQLGNAQESITVEANAVQVQADSGEVSSVITGQQVTQLATNGRSMYTLEALTPGASSTQQDFQIPTSAGGDNNVSFNGLRVSHNLWLIDGGEAADRGGGGGADVMPSMDAIGEFRMLTSNYSAEYGLSSAGTLTMVIKSGTRKFHAAGWYFGRNDALDARNYFNPAVNANGTTNKVAELRFHTWGFNVGGPVSFHPNKSNPKTFFFYNMEWRRLIQGGLINTTVPLASEYPGANGAVFPSNVVVNDPTLAQVPAAIQYANCPGGVAPAGVTPGAQFPNNTIPNCMIDPNSAALLTAGVFPKPTSGSQFQGGNNAPTSVKEEIARIDHQFTDKFSIFGHWISDQSSQTFGTSMWSGDNVPTVFNTFGNPGYHATIHATYMIHPNLLNEVAFNYDGNRIHILPAGLFKQPSGFTESTVFGGNSNSLTPDINLNQLNTQYIKQWMPWNNSADDYQVRDDVSWTHGAHQFKFGGSWAIYKKVQDWFATPEGSFTFNGSYTGLGSGAAGLDFADFLLGYASGYSENAIKSAGYWNAVSPAAYIQDNWRATHRLTLNLGLRWDGMPHTYEASDRMSNFLPSLYNPANAPIFANGNDSQIAANSPGLGTSTESALQGLQFYLNGIAREGTNGVSHNMTRNTWNAFGPRIGFAYDLTGNGKTIIRGGFGTMYERIQGNDMYNAANNAPWNYSLNTGNLLFSNPSQFANGNAITAPILVSSITGLSQQYKVPTSYQYSLGVQRQLGNNVVMSVSYVGDQNRYQSYGQNINLPPQSQLANLINTRNGPNGAVDGSGNPENSILTYPGYSSIVMAFTGANSHYNSLQAELHGRVTRDLDLQAAYTLSRAIDPSTGGSGMDLANVSNPYLGWKFDVGPSMLDRTHVFFTDFVYSIPFLRNSQSRFLKTAVGGWELSGIITAQTGTPLNVSYNGTSVCNVVSNCSIRPDLVGSISYPKSATTLNGGVSNPTIQWFSPSSFGAPAIGAFGNLGYNALRGPGRDNWNLSLFKEFVISEDRGTRFEFRAESFNTWNHTEFGGAGTNAGVDTTFSPGSTTFGKVKSAWDPRVFQLGAKLIF
jgi:hypothetical protein